MSSTSSPPRTSSSRVEGTRRTAPRRRDRPRRRDLHRLDRAPSPRSRSTDPRREPTTAATRQPRHRRHEGPGPDRARPPLRHRRPARRHGVSGRVRRASGPCRSCSTSSPNGCSPSSRSRGDLERLIRFTCTAIPACDAASIALLIDGQPSTVAVTEHVALELDIAQYDNDEGPCLDALHGHPIRVDLLDRDERFNHFAQGAASHAVNSVLSIPINHRDDIVGTLNLYARAANAFDDDDTVTAQIAATQAANAIVRSDIVAAGHRLRDQLQAVYDEATLTARAQGVLIGIEHCSAEQAQHLLTHAANATGTSLAATAQRILDAARDQPPSTH